MAAVAAGKDQSNSLDCGTFFYISGHLEVTRHLWRLTEIPGHFAGLLTHSKNVTTSINCKKTVYQKFGGHGPRGPSGYATG